MRLLMIAALLCGSVWAQDRTEIDEEGNIQVSGPLTGPPAGPSILWQYAQPVPRIGEYLHNHKLLNIYMDKFPDGFRLAVHDGADRLELTADELRQAVIVFDAQRNMQDVRLAPYVPGPNEPVLRFVQDTQRDVDTTPTVTAEDVTDAEVLKRYQEQERGRLAAIENLRLERESMINGMRRAGYTEPDIEIAANAHAARVAEAANEETDIVEVRTKVEAERQERERQEEEERERESEPTDPRDGTTEPRPR